MMINGDYFLFICVRMFIYICLFTVYILFVYFQLYIWMIVIANNFVLYYFQYALLYQISGFSLYYQTTQPVQPITTCKGWVILLNDQVGLG